jgi:ACS family pantothenate transporter-like MFS transporter
MNAIGQGVMAGTQVVQYPATGAPNFHDGWSSNLSTAIAQLFVILLIMYMSTRDSKQKQATDARETDAETDSSNGNETGVEKGA